MRCFVAIELEEGLQMKLGALQKELRSAYRLNDKAIKWVRPENLHLTLKFLGEVADEKIPPVCAAVSEAAGEYEVFDIDLGGVGCFPERGPARVLWTGVRNGSRDLIDLAGVIDRKLHQLGFDLEARPYRPHLTLARMKNTTVGHHVQQVVSTLEPREIGGQGVISVTVFQSVLDRAGPTYTAVHHAPLS